MFNTELLKKLKEENNNLRELLRDKDWRIEKMKEARQSDSDLTQKTIEKEVMSETSELKKATLKAESKVAVLEKEIEILNKAFENMGFDVKDMKDILNKLVDAVVAKNEIKLINTNK